LGPGSIPNGIELHLETNMEKPLLHLVFGGELADVRSREFADPDALDIVGIFPNYALAHDAWQSAAQRTIDNAQTRYFIVHLHRLLDPDEED
jgi:hypothetical protein